MCMCWTHVLDIFFGISILCFFKVRCFKVEILMVFKKAISLKSDPMCRFIVVFCENRCGFSPWAQKEAHFVSTNRVVGTHPLLYSNRNNVLI